ncbi:actin cytoskeleton and mitosis protein [Datura stramonium]|uniref:Actin cytoskeleton and mitosis protein n=1 Tax=Datura stramonium TaxID=4076 RepID=A0ABS8WRC7_DATST|nr:actin cytoskeleton and mitosis protein [Datura stramonium]
MVDLTKDFFFSYSYHVMRSLQQNMCNNETGPDLYDTMFVWNEYLTRGIRNLLHNTVWTVALVYGFFKQDTLSLSGRDFKLTLIARRSRHYAGTRIELPNLLHYHLLTLLGKTQLIPNRISTWTIVVNH